MKNSVKNKILKKTIATMLLFVMVFQFMPNIVMAVTQGNNNHEEVAILEEKTNQTEEKLTSLEAHLKEEREKEKAAEAVVVGELENERTLNEKHFLMSDGTIVASIFPSNIHYESNGKMLDVDNSLEEILDTKQSLKKKEADLKLEEAIKLAASKKVEAELNINNTETIQTEASLEPEKANTNLEPKEDSNINLNLNENSNTNLELTEENLTNNLLAEENTELNTNLENVTTTELNNNIQKNINENNENEIEKNEITNSNTNLESNEAIPSTTIPQENVENIETITTEKIDEIEKVDEKLAEELKKETKIYTNKTGNAKINFSNKTSGFNLGSMESEGHLITWGLVNSRASKLEVKSTEKKENKIQGQKAENIEIDIPQTELEYEDILSNVNIEYWVEPEKIKENIILKNKEAIGNELKFIYDAGNLKMKLLENNDIIVYNETEENVIYTIKAPFMYDGNLEYNYDIKVELEEQEGKYIITLNPDKSWLEDEKRVYPVTIDPSIITSRYYQDIQDTYIYSTQGTSTKGGAHIIRAGNGGGPPSRSLIKFNLPELKAGDQVIGAYLSIFSYPKTTEWTPPTRQIQLDVHKMTSDWDESTAVWNNTNTNYQARAQDFITYQFDYSNQCKQYTLDITTVAKEWYTTGNNYGVMLKEHVESNDVAGNEAYFISSDTTAQWYEGRPVAQIIYRNQTGLEDYLSYHVQDLGRAGTVYTNDYNGNVIWEHEDISTPGERMPVTIKHIYNTNDRNIEARYGRGVMLNINQTVELVTIGGTDYAEYVDGDGTRHYFTKQSTYTYKDEDGLELELTLNPTTVMFELKDKGDNIIRFERRKVAGRYLWHLKEIEDSDGNKTTLTFLSTVPDQFIVTKVTDAAGQSITFQYSGYYLSKLVGPDGKTIEYTYSSNVLSSITYPDGKKTYYDFSAGILNAVQKIDGTLVKYQYYPDKTKRVKTITEYANDAVTHGDSISIAYSNNLTTFTDNKGYSNNVTFNDWGQAISVADYGKGGTSFKDAYGKVYNYGTSGGSKNKLTLDGKLTKSVNNMLMNGSAEHDGYWESDNWGNNKGVNSYTNTTAYSGNRALQITSTQTDNSVVPFYKQYTSAKKGKTYVLSAKIKTNNITSSHGTGAMLIAYYKDNNGKTQVLTSGTIQGTKDWQDISFVIDYPSTATGPLYVGVGLLHCKGTAYYDDIQLEEGTIPNAYNMIENSNFEYRRYK